MTTIVEYSATEAALADLRTKYADAVFDTTTGKGMEAAKKARAELREHRVALEKERVRIKAPALERSRQIDSEAKRITAEIEALEQPIDSQIKQEEQRKAAAKAEAEQREREAREALSRRFEAIRGLPLRAVGKTAAEIEEIIVEAEAMPTDDFPDNMIAAARFELKIAVASLKAALDARIVADNEAARIEAERAELERLRAEQAERERQHAEQVAREQAERDAAARAEREAAEAARREQQRIEDERRAAEDARLREEDARLEEERKQFAAKKRAADKLAREQAIANATLYSAANEALALLRSEGFGEHITTLKLEAALGRETAQKKDS